MEINTLVLETLQRAVSQDPVVLKEAEKKLMEWETQPGFYVALKDIFCNPAVELNVRTVAVLFCKNGVEKYWRLNAPHCIQENEKFEIRETLLSNFHEPVKQIATHMAILIAKISRYDWPHHWNQLVPGLMSVIKSGDPLSQHRALLILYHVVKTLSTKRLTGDRRLFQDLTACIFPHIVQVWDGHAQIFFMKVSEDIDEASFALEKSLLALKILEKLTIHGCKKPHEISDVNCFIKVVFERSRAMLSIRTSMKACTEELANKFITRGTNILLGLLEHHPLSFVSFITPALEFVVYYAFTTQGETCVFERFLIQCFNLIKAVILCQEYKPAKVVEDTNEPEALRAHQMKQAFFVADTLNVICKKLITHYFLLTQQDLEQWASDPEAFATDEGGESWKYSLRPSAETLFASLFHEYREPLTPLVVELVQQNRSLVSPYDLSAILIKDAVYNAVGIGSFDLYYVINIDEWFTSSLKMELTVEEPNYRILRRRIACLLSCWAGVQLSTDLYPEVYSSMLGLLRGGEDMAVRIAAANTVKSLVDDFDFNLETFLDYLEPMFLSLFNLLKEAQECDTKMRVLHVLYFVVERVGDAIEPYYNTLVQYLPLLWNETENHSMLRCAVVATLVHLVKAIGKINESPEVLNFILSVISYSTDLSQDCHIYLLEDGLELWQCVIDNTPHPPTPQIMHLFNNMLRLLENNSEQLRLCVRIISGYLLLSPDDVIQVYGESIIRHLSELLSDMSSEGINLIMKLFELFLKINPTRSSVLLKPLLPRIFEIVYENDAFPMLMTLYLAILSRVLISSQEVFTEIVGKVSENVRKSPEEVLNKILHVWLNEMPLVSQLEKQKLLGLALSSLLISNFKFVYDKFAGIVLAVTEVLNDITRTDSETGARIDALYYTPETEDLGGYETEHGYRKKQVALKDPVHNIVLEDYFRSQLQKLEMDVGHEDFQNFVRTVDPVTLAQLREYVALS